MSSRSVTVDGFTIKERMWGRPVVNYTCPDCDSLLKSPISDIGNDDSCPNCQCVFSVPGEGALNAYRKLLEYESEIKEAEIKEAEIKEAEKAKTKEELLSNTEQENRAEEKKNGAVRKDIKLMLFLLAPGLYIYYIGLSKNKVYPFLGAMWWILFNIFLSRSYLELWGLSLLISPILIIGFFVYILPNGDGLFLGGIVAFLAASFLLGLNDKSYAATFWGLTDDSELDSELDSEFDSELS